MKKEKQVRIKSFFMKDYDVDRAARRIQEYADKGWELTGCLPVEIKRDLTRETSWLRSAQFFFKRSAP